MQQEEIDIGNSILRKINLSYNDFSDIEEYIFLTKGTKKFQENFDTLMEDLCPKYQLKITEGIFKKILLSNQVIIDFTNE